MRLLPLLMLCAACGTPDNGSTLLEELPGEVSFALALPQSVPDGYSLLGAIITSRAANIDFGTPKGGNEVLREQAPGYPLGYTLPVTKTVLVDGHEWQLYGNYALARVLPSGLSISISPGVENDASERSVAFMEVLAKAVEEGLASSVVPAD